MAPKVTKQHIIDERHNLAELLAGLSDEEWNKPSACEGWSIAQLGAHLVLGSSLPWGLVWGMLWTILTRQSFNKWMERELSKVAEKGPDHLVATYRKHKTPVIARFGAMGRMWAYLEDVVHQEDIRHPLGKPRLAPPNPEAIWTLVQLESRLFKQLKNRGRVLLQASDGRKLMYQVDSGAKPKLLEDTSTADASVRGEPLELLLFLVGRTADVAVEGEGPLAEELRTKPLKF